MSSSTESSPSVSETDLVTEAGAPETVAETSSDVAVDTETTETPAPVETPRASPAPKPAAPSNSRFSEAERTIRKDRVAKAKDAMARSVGLKGDHVAPARASLKMYLQRLNEPNQPDDARFELLINAPFTAPPKKKTNDRKF